MSGSTRNDRTKDFLDAIRAKVKDTEERRPEYAPDDLDNLINNITWALGANALYLNLEQLITAEIDAARSTGDEIPAKLSEELEDTRQKIKALVDFNNAAWADFTALTDEIKAEAKRRELEEQAKQPPVVSIGAHRIKNVAVPLDKVSATLWTLGPVDTQKNIIIKAEGKNSKAKINIPLSVDFSALEKIAPQIKELDGFSKRAWIVVNALYEAGNNIITFDQIHEYTGHKGAPNTRQAQRINDALSALNVQISFDNSEEIKAGYKYPHVKYTGAILPNERIESDQATILVNGKRTRGAVRILGPSRLLQYAVDRGQFAQVPVEVYQTPLDQNDNNLKIEDYFLNWILHALDKGDKSSRTRKMTTLYKEFNATGSNSTARTRRSDLKTKICKLLDYYISCELQTAKRQLVGYTMADDLELKLKKIE